MFTDPRPIDNKKDAGLRLKTIESFAFCKNQTSALLGLGELVACARELPVLFAQLENGFAPVAFLGTPKTGNRAVGEDGKWRFGYIPAVFRAYPFLLMQTDAQGETLAVSLERSCPALSEEEGTPLFEAEGKPAELLTKAQEMLRALHADQQRAQALGALLQEKKLLAPLALSVTQEGVQKTLPFEGLFLVNERALGELSDEEFLDLRTRGLLPGLYAHLFSLGKLGGILGGKREA